MEAPLTITIWSLVLEDKRNKTWDGFIFRAEINVSRGLEAHVGGSLSTCVQTPSGSGLRLGGAQHRHCGCGFSVVRRC